MPQKFFGTPRRESKISAPDVSPFDDILSVDDSDDGDAFSASHAENFFSNDFQDSDGEHDDAELSKAAIVEDDDVDYKRYSMTLLVVPVSLIKYVKKCVGFKTLLGIFVKLDVEPFYRRYNYYNQLSFKVFQLFLLRNIPFFSNILYNTYKFHEVAGASPDLTTIL